MTRSRKWKKKTVLKKTAFFIRWSAHCWEENSITADAVTGENAECFLIKKHKYEDRDAAKQLEYSCFAASFVSRCRVCSAMLYKFLPLRKKDRV